MSERGRPPEGVNLVGNTDASEDAKAKVKIILETISGERTVESACLALGIGKTAFHELRTRLLQAAVQEMEPKQAGRPRNEPEADSELAHLKQQNFELKRDLRLSQIRTEIALMMPHLLKSDDEPPDDKKKSKATHPQSKPSSKRPSKDGKTNTSGESK
jgi:hypothetical protein